MPSASASISMESEKIAFANGSSKTANFESKCKAIAIKTTGNVNIAFDRPANADDFLLEAADRVVTLRMPAEFTSVSAYGAGGTGTVYIIAMR